MNRREAGGLEILQRASPPAPSTPQTNLALHGLQHTEQPTTHHLRYLQQIELTLHGLQRTEQLTAHHLQHVQHIRHRQHFQQIDPTLHSLQSTLAYGASRPATPANRADSPQPLAYRVAHSLSPPQIERILHNIQHRMHHLRRTELNLHGLQHTELHTAHIFQHLEPIE